MTTAAGPATGRQVLDLSFLLTHTAHVLATLYRLLGIDPASTVPDLTGRSMYLLDDRDPITELT